LWDDRQFGYITKLSTKTLAAHLLGNCIHWPPEDQSFADKVTRGTPGTVITLERKPSGEPSLPQVAMRHASEHHARWMMCEQETLFHCIPVPWWLAVYKLLTIHIQLPT